MVGVGVYYKSTTINKNNRNIIWNFTEINRETVNFTSDINFVNTRKEEENEWLYSSKLDTVGKLVV